MNSLALTGIIAVTIGLVEIIKCIIYSFIKRFDSKDINKVIYQIRDICNMHNHVDDNGIPLSFTPRSLEATQTKILELTKDICNTQKNICSTMERTIGILDRIDRRNGK